MCVHSGNQNQIGRVFAHAFMLPETACDRRCRLERLVAVSEDGKEFCGEVDQNRYQDSCWEIWDAFRAYCAKLGLRSRWGEVWYSESIDKAFRGQAASCTECKYADCFILSDNMEYLAHWELRRMEWEYSEKSVHLSAPISMEELKAICGYDAANEPYAGRDLYRRYREVIDKDTFSEEECLRMAKYVEDNHASASNFGKISACLIEALLRLQNYAPELYEKSMAVLSADFGRATGDERRRLNDFFEWLDAERRDCRMCSRETPAPETVGRNI